jgi:cell division transport system permease protein
VTFRNIEFVIQEAFIGIWRNGVMAVAALTTISLSLSILGAFLLLSMGTKAFVERELGKFEIGVYLSQTTPRLEADEIGKKIRQTRGVKEVLFIPKEDAWPEFKKNMASKLDLGGVEANPLPDAYRVKVHSAEVVEAIAQKIRGMEGIERVKEGRNELRHVLAIARFVSYIGAVAISVLVVTCVFIISNAIRLTVFARRREIRIMQLVGATDGFIRTPLVIEGMLLGALGALISLGAIKLGGYYLAGVVAKMMPLLTMISSGVNGAHFAWGLVLTGALAGAIGSLLSIRKFL